MIFQYTTLKRNPTIFRAVTGLKISEFDEYVAPLIIQLAQQERQAFERNNRQRAVGGGRNHDLDGCNQFLLTLVWLKLYPTYEVLGYFFGISDSSAYRVVKRCLPWLETVGRTEIQRAQAHARQNEAIT